MLTRSQPESQAARRAAPPGAVLVIVSAGVLLSSLDLFIANGDTFPVSRFQGVWWVAGAVALAGVLPAFTMLSRDKPEAAAEQPRSDAVTAA